MADKKIFSTEPVSKEFEDEFTDAGCLVAITCGFCGREHFCNPDIVLGDYEEGHYERLVEQAKAEPDNYREYDYTISYGYLAGRCFIPDCHCNGAKPYEDFIKDNIYRISGFYKRLLALQKSETEMLENQLSGISN